MNGPGVVSHGLFDSAFLRRSVSRRGLILFAAALPWSGGCGPWSGVGTDDGGSDTAPTDGEENSPGDSETDVSEAPKPCFEKVPIPNVLRDSDHDLPPMSDTGVSWADNCSMHHTFEDCVGGDWCVPIVMAPVLEDGSCGPSEFLACRSDYIDSYGRTADCPDRATHAMVPGRGCYATINVGVWCSSSDWPSCDGPGPFFSCSRESFCEEE